MVDTICRARFNCSIVVVHLGLVLGCTPRENAFANSTTKAAELLSSRFSPGCSAIPCTSMSLALTFAALRAAKPTAKAIVWPRMDQKSCLKAIVAAGFTPVVVENLVEVGTHLLI